VASRDDEITQLKREIDGIKVGRPFGVCRDGGQQYFMGGAQSCISSQSTVLLSIYLNG